jgi:signal transduction histidine kinase
LKKTFLILFFFVTVFGQNKFDSVLESIKNKPDSAQINTLNNFCWRYRNINPDLALKAAELALQLGEKTNDKINKSKTLGYLSVIYRDRGEYQKSLNMCQIGLDLASSINDWKQKGYSYNNMASVYRLMGNYPLALETNYKGLQIFEEHNNQEGTAFCNYNIGIIYLRQENYKKALEFFEKTVTIRKQLKDKDGEAKALSRIAELYVETGDYSRSLTIYGAVENVYNEMNDLKSVMNVWMGRAYVYEKLKEYNKALAESKRALVNSKSFNDVEGVVRNSSLIGLLYGRLGQFGEGKKYFDQAMVLSAKTNSSFLRISFLENITKFYELQGDFKNAYKFLEIHNSYKDSIEQKQRSSVVVEVEAAYLTNRQEKEKELLERDLAHQKNVMTYWIFALMLIVAVFIIIAILYNAQRKANAIKDKLFGIIAHDLKNPFSILMTASQILTNKDWQISQKEKEQYLDMIASSSKKTYALLENLLFWSRSQRKGLALAPRMLELQEAVDDTINLVMDQAEQKKIALQNKVDIECRVYVDEEVLKLVIRNLVTNSIKFTQPGGKIIINAYLEKSKYVVLIEDDGVGMPKEKADKIFEFKSSKTSFGTKGEKGTGLGLLICKEFIEKSGGKIWVISEIDKGTKFFFTVPAGK